MNCWPMAEKPRLGLAVSSMSFSQRTGLPRRTVTRSQELFKISLILGRDMDGRLLCFEESGQVRTTRGAYPRYYIRGDQLDVPPES